MNLEFDVLQGQTTPVIKYNNLRLLFDTGASTPVWCPGLSRFIEKFPSAKKMDYRFLLTGFGRSEDELIKFLRNPDSKDAENYFADVYSMPEFILESKEGRLIWKDLNVAVTNRIFSGVHLILSYTMFGGMELNLAK